MEFFSILERCRNRWRRIKEDNNSITNPSRVSTEQVFGRFLLPTRSFLCFRGSVFGTPGSPHNRFVLDSLLSREESHASASLRTVLIPGGDNSLAIHLRCNPITPTSGNGLTFRSLSEGDAFVTTEGHSSEPLHDALATLTVQVPRSDLWEPISGCVKRSGITLHITRSGRVVLCI